MNTWKDAWAIFLKDLRIDRMYLLWSVIFMIYTGGMIGVMLRGREAAGDVLDPMADFLMLILTPFLGFYFSRRSFSYIKEDSYTQMLLYYRTLPISDKTIMVSRLIQLVSALLFNGLILFSVIYSIFLVFDIEITLVQYLAFALTWIGYSLAMNGLFIHLEFTRKGRTYLWLTILLMIFMGGGAFVFTWFDGSLLNLTLDFSKRYGLLSPLMWGVLAGGVIVLGVSSSITRRTMHKRDLAR
ncbi:ABC-2 family transporter [Fontibacillus phaseoli]|uniref:ABC-2 family transporter n=1 Tax=Fontibacillus phaseoli TaxID=1416533 RepID=A0A369B3Y1_9BACL|nr:ABC-2 transporter permease [Fontibacillus phaseoli]RCX16161.1 ABC-2 family transporter [Fontibacillus phaseoli]